MRVRTGKPIRATSLLGNQTSLVFNSQAETISMLGAGNRVCLKQGSYYIMTIGSGVNITLDSSHKYFIMMKIIGALNNTSFNIYYCNDDAQYSLETTQYKILTDKAVCAILTGETKFRAAHLYTWSNSFDETSLISYYLLADLTSIFGSGKEPTAEQFYNKYKDKLELLATGEEITLDSKTGKIITEDSNDDIISCNPAVKMYGYNQLVSTINKTKTKTTTSTTYTSMDSASIAFYSSHKYLITGDVTKSTNANIRMRYPSLNATFADNGYWLGNPSENITALTFQIASADGEEATGTIDNIQAIDLTDWYGPGKEPSTLEEFKSKFPNNYYGFCSKPIKLTKNMINNQYLYGYNQSVPIDAASETKNNLTFTNNRDGSWTVNGTASANTLKSMMGGLQIYSGHTYLMLGSPKGSSSTTYYLLDAWSASVGFVFEAGKIVTLTSNKTFQAAIQIQSGVVCDNLIFKPIFIDLTDWYGEGNEPTTIEEFKQTFPHKYYPYSTKSLLNKYMINALGND